MGRLRWSRCQGHASLRLECMTGRKKYDMTKAEVERALFFGMIAPENECHREDGVPKMTTETSRL